MLYVLGLFIFHQISSLYQNLLYVLSVSVKCHINLL